MPSGFPAFEPKNALHANDPKGTDWREDSPLVPTTGRIVGRVISPCFAKWALSQDAAH